MSSQIHRQEEYPSLPQHPNETVWPTIQSSSCFPGISHISKLLSSSSTTNLGCYALFFFFLLFPFKLLNWFKALYYIYNKQSAFAYCLFEIISCLYQVYEETENLDRFMHLALYNSRKMAFLSPVLFSLKHGLNLFEYAHKCPSISLQ